MNKQKRKGIDWERQFVNIMERALDKYISIKRIPNSGSVGSILEEPLLCSDVVLKSPFLDRTFRFELKTGYGGDKQITVKKEWLDKVTEEAERVGSIPVLSCKFSGAKNGVKYFVSIPLDYFVEILLMMIRLRLELDKIYGKAD